MLIMNDISINLNVCLVSKSLYDGIYYYYNIFIHTFYFMLFMNNISINLNVCLVGKSLYDGIYVVYE